MKDMPKPVNKPQRILRPFSTKKIIADEMDKVLFGKFGFKDENRKIVIEAQYDSCGEFSCGLCPVAYQSWYHTSSGKRDYEMHWGYIDENGKERIPFKFRDARDFNKYGVAAVCDEYGTGYYLIDTRGRKLLYGKDIDAECLYNHKDRYFEFRKGDLEEWRDNVGVYDTKKKKVFLEPHTGGISEHSEDVICVYEPGPVCDADFSQHYINSEGEELYPGLVNKGFNIVELPDPEGYAIVAIFEFFETPDEISGSSPAEDGKSYFRVMHYGVSDLDGNLVLPAEYESIFERKDGKFVCRKDGQEEIIDLKKKVR